MVDPYQKRDLLHTLGSDPSSKRSDGLVVVSYHGIKTREGFFKGRSHKVVNIKVVYSSTDARSINTMPWSIVYVPRRVSGVGHFVYVSLQ